MQDLEIFQVLENFLRARSSTDCHICVYKECTIENMKNSIQHLKQENDFLKKTLQDYRNQGKTCCYCYKSFEDIDKLQMHFRNCIQLQNIIYSRNKFRIQEHPNNGILWSKKPHPEFKETIAKHYIIKPIVYCKKSQEKDLQGLWDEAITF